MSRAQNLQKQQKRHIQNPDDKQNPEGVAEEEDAAPTDEDLQAAIEAARQRRLEADKKSL